LFAGPLDIVGDVHGEIDTLRSLLRNLGYNHEGIHPQGRRLIFLGDLTDRGPDSPAVIELVRELIAAGQAQSVLGNHDLNILLGHTKPENKWFFGKEYHDDQGAVVPQMLADDGCRERVCDLFRSLPIALERDDLRIVHACWNDAMIDLARTENDVCRLYEQHRERIAGELATLKLDPLAGELQHQNDNPVKLLTSGSEEKSDTPINSGGKIRYERRVPWWNDYNGPFCVFGHYSISDGQPRGNSSAFCVDFGVGQRWKERRGGKASGFNSKLAALRFPEREIVFDEGEVRKL